MKIEELKIQHSDLQLQKEIVDARLVEVKRQLVQAHNDQGKGEEKEQKDGSGKKT